MSLADLASIGSFVSGVAVSIFARLSQPANPAEHQAFARADSAGARGRIADTALRLAEFPEAVGFDKCFADEADVTAAVLRSFLDVARAIFISAEEHASSTVTACSTKLLR